MKVFNKVLNKEYTNAELYVLSDLHLEDNLCDRKQFDKWRKEVLEEPYRYVILNGDILDNATKNSVSFSYETRLSPAEAINKIVELLEPLKDRILLITEGNHEKRSYKESGIRVMERVARELGLRDYYSDNAYLLFLNVGKNRGRETHQTVYSIYGKHGSISGRTEGSKLNGLMQMGAICDADLYLHSHSHQAVVLKQNSFRSDYRHKMAIEVPHTYVNTNAFLLYGGYGETAGFKPANRDYPKIILNGSEKDIKVIL